MSCSRSKYNWKWLSIYSFVPIRFGQHNRTNMPLVFSMSVFTMVFTTITCSVPAKQPLSTTVIKVETDYYLLLIAVVNGHFFHFDFPVLPEP